MQFQLRKKSHKKYQRLLGHEPVDSKNKDHVNVNVSVNESL